MNNKRTAGSDGPSTVSTKTRNLMTRETGHIKINCSKAELLRGVQAVQAALSSRTTLPILLNFLMETEGDRVKLVSTDLEMGMKHYIPAEVERTGSITIPAKKFLDIVGSLQEGADVSLEADEGSRVHLKSGRSRFNLAGAPKSEYPVLPEFSKDLAFQLPADALADMLRKTIFAASSDETRYVLNGVFWLGAGGNLELVATDGRRLAVAKRKCLPNEREFRAIVPTKILNEVLRLATDARKGEAGAVLAAVSENQIAFQFKDTTMLSRLVEGSFPNYEQVLPARKDLQVEIEAQALLAITKRASLCAAERGGAVRYAFRPGALHVHASSQNMEFDDETPVDYKGEEFVIAFNPQFLLDGLKNMDADRVSIGMTTPTNPAVLQAADDPEYRYVVMPMRV